MSVEDKRRARSWHATGKQRKADTVERNAKREDVSRKPLPHPLLAAAKVQDLGGDVAPVAVDHLLPHSLCSILPPANVVIMAALQRQRLCRTCISKVPLRTRVGERKTGTLDSTVADTTSVHETYETPFSIQRQFDSRGFACTHAEVRARGRDQLDGARHGKIQVRRFHIHVHHPVPMHVGQPRRDVRCHLTTSMHA